MYDDDDLEGLAFEPIDEPINIHRTAQQMIEQWGANAPTMAFNYAALFNMTGNPDSSATWTEVKKVIEFIFSAPGDMH